MRGLLTVTLMALFTSAIHAQYIKRPEIDLERFIEEIFAIQSGDVSSEELFEQLLLIYSNPINLNNTNEEELRSLFILSENQLHNFDNYIKQHGKLLSIYELQAIPSFDLTTINRLLPFVTVREAGLSGDNRSLLQRVLAEENNYLLLRYDNTLENKRGYLPPKDSTDNRYIGNKGKYYTRFRVSHNNDFSIGFTAEKDAGEKVNWDSQDNEYGADFYSGHIQLQNQGILKNIVLGDYQIQYGQSLLLGAGFNIGKGSETITTIRRANLGIRPYTSAIETNFFRGLATTLSFNKNIETTFFYSRLRQDAAIKSDTLISESYISSIQQSGFHRTINELNNRDQLIERNYGGNILFKSNNRRLSLGSTIISTDFSEPINRTPRNYNQFEFDGLNNYSVGLFGDYNWQNVNLFAEFARSKSGGFGSILGLIANLTDKLETSILIRNYEQNFHTFYGNAFGESTRNINESGWYWGLKYTFNRKISFTGYFDSFQFPWLRASINAPSNGYEYLSRITYTPTRTISFYAQIREESKANNLSTQDQKSEVRFPLEGIKRNYLVGIRYPANTIITFKSRVQWSTYDFNSNRTKGYAMWQDINVDLNKFRLTGRIAVFDTDDFNNAQYAFENDVLYFFSVPAYNGRGTRQYVVLQYRPLKKLTLWAKFARTNFRDREEIGSGLETIEGSKRTDIRIQARINF